MHTIKVIAAGIALLAVCVALGRWLGPSPVSGLALGIKVFIPLWLLGAAINMWIGVTRAGYSVAEEAPIFAIVFAVPVAIALLLWWLSARATS